MFEGIPREARPSAEHCALITIDMQEDFVREGAPAEIEGTNAVVPSSVRLVEAFRDARRPVIHAVRLYPTDGSDGELSRRERLRELPTIVAPGTTGAELIPEMRRDPLGPLDPVRLLAGELVEVGDREWVMFKPRWSAFFGTPLAEHLMALGVDSVAVCGCNFPNCPRATLFDATERDFRALVVSDAVSRFRTGDDQDMLSIGVGVEEAGSVTEWVGHSE